MARIPKTVLEALAQQPVFSSCSQRELESIARIGTKIKIEPGYVLTREGRRGYEFFVVEDGTATCTIDGREVATYGSGDFFGEMSLLEQQPRSATIVADTPMSVIAIDSREFASMLALAPSTSKKIMAALSSRLRDAQAATP